MTDKVVKRAPKKKAANAYKLPDPISAGEILTDLAKQQWILGMSIGVGGFGEIYSGIFSFWYIYSGIFSFYFYRFLYFL